MLAYARICTCDSFSCQRPQKQAKTYQNDLQIFSRCIDESTKGNEEEIDLPLTLMHLIYMQRGDKGGTETYISLAQNDAANFTFKNNMNHRARRGLPTTTCVTPRRFGSSCSLLRIIPVVQKRSLVLLLFLDSPRI